MGFLLSKRFLILSAAGGVLLLYFFINPVKAHFPGCFFHRLTGFYCPGCGVQRSFHAILNGDILQALDYNLLFVIMIPFLVYFFVMVVSGKKWGKNALILKPAFSYTILILFVGFWILRNVPVYPFNYLAP